jgi:hypothetical protein
MTTRRALEDLNAHGVVDRRPAEKGKGDGKSDMWRLADVARARHLAIVTEKSAGENDACTSTSTSTSPFLYNQYHYDDDISVTTAKTAPECGFQSDLDDAETPVARHCWDCKEEVGDADRCPSCGWIPCSCGACSPECDGPESNRFTTHGGEGDRRVEVEV